MVIVLTEVLQRGAADRVAQLSGVNAVLVHCEMSSTAGLEDPHYLVSNPKLSAVSKQRAVVLQIWLEDSVDRLVSCLISVQQLTGVSRCQRCGSGPIRMCTMLDLILGGIGCCQL